MFPRAKVPPVKSDTGVSGDENSLLLVTRKWCPSGEKSDRNASLIAGLNQNEYGRR